jgi:hypothetical protein
MSNPAPAKKTTAASDLFSMFGDSKEKSDDIGSFDINNYIAKQKTTSSSKKGLFDD